MTTIRTLLAAALLALALPALAQPYAILGVGVSSAERIGLGNVDSRGLFPSFGLGYRASKWIAVEASWYKPDLISFSHSVSGNTTTTTERSARGPRISALLLHDLSPRMSVFLSASVYSLDGKSNTTQTTTPGAPPFTIMGSSASTSGSETTMGLGAGIEAELAKSLRARFSVDVIETKAKLYQDQFGDQRVVNARVEVVKSF